MSYTLRKEEEEEEADGGEILGGTGYGRWGRVFLFSKSTPSCDTNTTQNCCPFLYRSNATKSEVTRFLNVPLDVSDVFLMTFMILLDSYMEPTRVGSDNKKLFKCSSFESLYLTSEQLIKTTDIYVQRNTTMPFLYGTLFLPLGPLCMVRTKGVTLGVQNLNCGPLLVLHKR